MTPAARIRRRLAFRFEDDGSLSGTFQLPPLAGAVLLKALRAAAADLEPPDPADREHPDLGSRPTASRSHQAFPRKRRPRAARWRRPHPASPTRCWSSPRHSWAARSLPPMTRTSTRSSCTSAPTPSPPAAPMTARPPRLETFSAANAGPRRQPPSAAPSAGPDDPADPARCHVEDGPAISVNVAQMIACSATWSWMLHDSAGKLLDLGRRRRRPSTAMRRRPRENGTNAGAGSRAVSPAGSTCTISSTGPTAAGRSWTTSSACAATTTSWSTTAAT